MSVIGSPCWKVGKRNQKQCKHRKKSQVQSGGWSVTHLLLGGNCKRALLLRRGESRKQGRNLARSWIAVCQTKEEAKTLKQNRGQKTPATTENR
jgi:hypothetical protein